MFCLHKHAFKKHPQKEEGIVNTGSIINIAVIILLLWFVYSRVRPAKGLKALGTNDFQNVLESTEKRMLIDVREPGEYKTGYISGAKNIPLSQLSGRLGEIPKEKDVFLYCRSGIRSKNAARILLKNGYTGLVHLQGGILTTIDTCSCPLRIYVLVLRQQNFIQIQGWISSYIHMYKIRVL
ncbi:rhodanese-like domain-containing protein [Paenibacillus tianjinensis]|uniref:Rhodanese-like domain-containing protein n=2 Tax=Paenibacillus tianjinensis TaxID=2810347 RepID=A0ABX7LIE1_9BACL|nr:rhodanese-like domain-containing protein [Paenibacillus tianjinensis]